MPVEKNKIFQKKIIIGSIVSFILAGLAGFDTVDKMFGGVPSKYVSGITSKYFGYNSAEPGSFQWYLNEANNGNAEAQHKVCMLYESGDNDVIRDYKEALNWCEKSANNGNIDAQKYLVWKYYWTNEYRKSWEWSVKLAESSQEVYELLSVADTYSNGNTEYGVSLDKNKALEWYIKTINSKNRTENNLRDIVSAYEKMGDIYYHGYNEVKQDYKKALELYIDGYNTYNSEDLALKIGLMYFFGEGSEKNIIEATNWLQKGNKYANYFLEHHISKYVDINKISSAMPNINEPLECFKASKSFYFSSFISFYNEIEKEMLHHNKFFLIDIKKGYTDYTGYHVNSEYLKFLNIINDVSEDLDNNLKILEKNSCPSLEYVVAQEYEMLGLFDAYQKGDQLKLTPLEWISLDKEQDSIKWYLNLANKGFIEGINKIGEVYYYGKKATKSYNESLKWHLKAAEQGDLDSMFSLGSIYMEKEKYKDALKYFLKVSEFPNAPALSQSEYNIGVFYFNGSEGINKNLPAAKIWIKKSAAHGLPRAKEVLSEFFSED